MRSRRQPGHRESWSRRANHRNGTAHRGAWRAARRRTARASARAFPKVGAPDCIEIELPKVPNTTGAPLRTSWVVAMPTRASARICATVPATVTGLIAPERMKGETTQAWPAAAYTFRAPSIVPSKVIGELALIRLMMQQRLSTVSAPSTIRASSIVSSARSGRGDGTHEGLVAVPQVGMHHVEVPLVYGDVDRLADGASRVMHGRRHVGEFHEVAEVLDGRIAAPVIEIVDEGRSVDWSEDGRSVTDLDVPVGIAGMLHERGGRRFEDLAGKAPGQTKPLGRPALHRHRPPSTWQRSRGRP